LSCRGALDMQQVSHSDYRFFTAALTWAVALTLCCQAFASEAAEERAFALQFVAEHCAACHGAKRPKADLSLEALRDVTAENADVWERCLAQIAMGEMPPKRRQPQPRGEDRERMIAWLMKSLGDVGRSPQLPGGPLPTAGNLVSHEQLFSGLHRGPAWSPPRYWRRSQHQYDALMEELWVIPKLRYEKAPTRDDPRWAAYSYAQPFPPLGPEGFSDYAGGVHA